MVDLSTLAVSTFTPALNVLSTVLPESTFFSVVFTIAPPLPGLWCWNQMTDQSWPSRLSTMPFFRSFVEAMAGQFLRWSEAVGTGAAAHRSPDDAQLLGGRGQDLRP